MTARALSRRAILAAVAVLLPGSVVASFFTEWRAFGGDVAWLGCALFGVGALAGAVTGYLSFLRYPIYRLRGGSPEQYEHVSGVPLVGDAMIVGLAFAPPSVALSAVALPLVFFNSGSLMWFVIATWRDAAAWRAD